MRFRSLILSRLRVSNRFSRSKESSSISQAETVVHIPLKAELLGSSTSEITNYQEKDDEPFSAWHYAIHGPDIDWSTHVYAESPRSSASDTETIVYDTFDEDVWFSYRPGFRGGTHYRRIDGLCVYVKREDETFAKDDTLALSFTIDDVTYDRGYNGYYQKRRLAALAEDNNDTSQKSISETETIIHKSQKESFESVVSIVSVEFENTTYHQEKAGVLDNKSVTTFAEDNIDTSRKSISETETIIHKSLKRESFESVEFKNSTYHQEKVAVFEKKNVATFARDNIDTSRDCVPKKDITLHSSSKGEPLGALYEDFNPHKVWQGERWTPSQYSLSIYSQDGIDDVACTLRTKEIKELKSMLHKQQLQINELTKKSQLSVSETETVVHSPLNRESLGSFISEYPIDEPKGTEISRRQKYRNKFRRYLTSTQELIAPLKILHPNNRPEKGHANTTKQPLQEAVEARYATFKSAPFESTEEGEAPIFYGFNAVEDQAFPVTEQHVEEQSLLISEHPVRVKYSAEDYIGFIKDLTDDFLADDSDDANDYPQFGKKLADDYLGVTGFNPRTGVIDSSEEHTIPQRKRVHWSTTETGWESTERPMITETFNLPYCPPVVKTYIPKIRAPLSPIAVETFRAPRSPIAKVTLKSPQADNVDETLKKSEPAFLDSDSSQFCMSTATSTTTTGDEILSWRQMIGY